MVFRMDNRLSRPREFRRYSTKMDSPVNPYDPQSLVEEACPVPREGIGIARSFALTCLVFSILSVTLESASLMLAAWSPFQGFRHWYDLALPVSIVLIPLSVILAAIWAATNTQWTQGRSTHGNRCWKGIPVLTGFLVGGTCIAVNRFLAVKPLSFRVLISIMAMTCLATYASFQFQRLTQGWILKPNLAAITFSLLCLASVGLGFVRATGGALGP